MSKFIPYNSNPFEEPDIYRLTPESDDDAGRYALFIKNLIAALYYQDFNVQNFWPYREGEKSQGQLYEQYLKGNLKIIDFDDEPISPLITFLDIELDGLKNEQMPEAKEYINFLTAHKKVFACIDRAVNYNFGKEYIDYSHYIYDKMGKLDYLEYSEISRKFKSIQFTLVNQLKRQLIANLEIQELNHVDLKEDLDALGFYLNNELINSKTTLDIKKHTVQWFGQLLRHMGFGIGWHDYKGFFDDAKELCSQTIGYTAPAPNVSDIQYPQHIFSNPNAYLLFHALASRMDKKSPISFLYRKMAEKDNLIRVRDKEFRDWFNGCSYPATLHTTTETFERAFTAEREVFLDLLYEKYQLP